eukprot:UN3094
MLLPRLLLRLLLLLLGLARLETINERDCVSDGMDCHAHGVARDALGKRRLHAIAVLLDVVPLLLDVPVVGVGRDAPVQGLEQVLVAHVGLPDRGPLEARLHRADHDPVTSLGTSLVPARVLLGHVAQRRVHERKPGAGELALRHLPAHLGVVGHNLSDSQGP